MSNPYSSFCEDFYVNVRLGSQLALPNQRETQLHFFERIQKEIPSMIRFRKSENGDLNLEEDRSTHMYRWITLEAKRLSAGHVNPCSLEESFKLHTLILQMAPHYLSLSNLEIEYLDVLFGFDIPFSGNHDEIVAESLLPESPLSCLNEEFGAKTVDFQPSMTLALSEDCRLQARLDVITRTNSYQVRTGDYNEDMISVYLILRRYWGDRPRDPLESMMRQLAQRGEQLCDTHVVPRIIRPISERIASRFN